MKHGARLNRILILIATVAAVVASVIVVRIARNGPKPVYDVELVKNGGMEQLDASGDAEGWYRDMWFWDDGISDLTLSTDAYEGEYALMVVNYGENDARFVQDIAVEPDAWYHLSCMVKSEDCGNGLAGAGISVLGCSATSEYAYSTLGDWVRLDLYGRTGEKQRTMSVALRVGGYSALNTGKAWFDDVSVTRVRSVPDAFEAVRFTMDLGGTASSPSSFAWPIAVTALVYAAACLIVLQRGRFNGELVRGTFHETLFCAVLGLALVARVVAAMLIRGYEVDMNCFEAWSWRLNDLGAAAFYDDSVFCDYPPGYLWVLWVLGKLRAILGIRTDGPVTWLLIKSVPIACDILCATLVYRLSRKRLGEVPSLLLGSFTAFNPAMLLDSAAWGQIDSVLILLLILCVAEAERGRWVTAIPLYFLSVLVKPQALLLGPVALIMIVAEAVLHPNRGKALFRILLGVALGFALTALVALPFVWNRGGGPVSGLAWLTGLYTRTMGYYNYATINACNLYELLGMNWADLSGYPALVWVGRGVYAAVFGAAAAFYCIARKRTGGRRQIYAICAMVLMVVYAFATKMHERYAMPAIVLLALAYAQDRDARLLYSGLLLTLGLFLNCAMVLQNEYLVDSMAVANHLASLLNVSAALMCLWACADLCITGRALLLKPRESDQEKKESFERRMPIREDSWLHMSRVDYLLMAGITLAYSVLAYVNLGVTRAPETYVRSSAEGESVVFELEESSEFHMAYYGGICNSTFTVEFSDNGIIWTEPHEALYAQSEVFRWLWYTPGSYESGEFAPLEAGYPVQKAKYIRVTFERVGMVLFEVAFLDGAGMPIPVVSVTGSGGDPARAMDPNALVDEQDAVPEYPTYLNSTYFDEIYYARTGYELLNGLNVYETTHPPLGKLFIMWGIQLFGMNPFGWRFMGTLMGVMMLPVMYLLIKQLIKRTGMAALGTLLMAVDCMHFTQTRICTIDSYAVLFIMLMYLFMFRYCQMSFHFDKLWKTLVPLALCGVAMGLGIASKWICVYAAVGLALLFFYTMIRRYVEYRGARQSQFLLDSQYVKKYWRNLGITLIWCVIWFIIVPLVIYYFSFYRYLSITHNFSVSSVWREQLNMLSYHASQTQDNHFFKSKWYSWPFIAWPMWFYDGNDFMAPGMVSSISCMGNPAVWWGGLAAMIFILCQVAIRKGDRSYIYVLVGFMAQYLPWILVPRSTFIYHYFASVPFIILAVVLWFDWARRMGYRWYKPVLIIYAGVAVILFAGFYPVISGLPMTKGYAKYLRWFNWYNYRP